MADYKALRAHLIEAYRENILNDGWGRYTLAKTANRDLGPELAIRFGVEEVSTKQARRVVNAVRSEDASREEVGAAEMMEKGEPEVKVHYDHEKGTGSASATFDQPTTLDEAIEALEINEADWEIVKPVFGTYQGQVKLRKHVGETSSGKPIYEDRHEVKTFYKFEFTLRQRHPFELQATFDALREMIRSEAPVFAANIVREKTGNLARVHIPDIHLGKEGFQADWSMEAAFDRVLTVVYDFAQIAKATGVDRFHVPIGHDLLHIDREQVTRRGTFHTTASGTPVERTTPWIDLYLGGVELTKEIIRVLLEAAPVDASVIPGNHGFFSEVGVGVAAREAFHNSPDVHFSVSRVSDQTYRWGRCGFLDTHGDDVAFRDLPMFFANAHHELWGSCDFREIATGHKHVKKTSPVGWRSNERGCMVHISPSLSPQDFWHRKFGYFGVPGAELMMYNKDRGPISTHHRFF